MLVDVSTTELPAQKVVGPEADIVAVEGVELISEMRTFKEPLLNPLPSKTATYVVFGEME
jgi:hypothetical protein